MSWARDQRGHVILVVALIAATLGLRQGRRSLASLVGGEGEPGPAPTLTQPGVDGAVATGLSPAARVRVVLLDGLRRDLAQTLPRLGELCGEGADLVVDMGFPTVSLPVQRALFTGQTQTQSGRMVSNRRLSAIPEGSLPARVPGSRAVAESHPDIVHSFGFAETSPPLDGSWLDGDAFARAAREAVTSDAPLVFVHVLRVDEAGHLWGAASADYRDAAAWSDALLGQLVAEERRAHGGGTRWFVLADHGHRPRGGHGDAEPEIRLVRGCIAGGLPAELPRTGALHLVDLHRALADSLALSPGPGATGRPLAFALAHPDPGGTLPRPSPAQWLTAAGCALLGLLATLWLLRGRALRAAVPLWVGVVYGALWLLHGAPTLSNRITTHPYDRETLAVVLPGLVVLVASSWWALRRASPGRVVAVQLALPAALLAGMLVLSGALPRLLGLTRGPPIMPLWTAQATLLGWLLLGSLPMLAVTVMVAAWLGRGQRR